MVTDCIWCQQSKSDPCPLASPSLCTVLFSSPSLPIRHYCPLHFLSSVPSHLNPNLHFPPPGSLFSLSQLCMCPNSPFRKGAVMESGLRFVGRQIRGQIPTLPLSSFMMLESHFSLDLFLNLLERSVCAAGTESEGSQLTPVSSAPPPLPQPTL